MNDEEKVAIVKSFDNGDFSALSQVVNSLRSKGEVLSHRGSQSNHKGTLHKKKPLNKRLSPIRSNSALKLRSMNNLSKASDYGKLIPNIDPNQRTFDSKLLSQAAMHPSLKNQLSKNIL